MTSPSLRKPPITRRSTLRSKCASIVNPPLRKGGQWRSLPSCSNAPLVQTAKRLRRQLAACCLAIALAATPAWANDSAPQDDFPAAGLPPEVEAPVPPAPKPVRLKARKQPAPGAAIVTDFTKSRSARTSGQRNIARTDFQNDADRVLKPMPDIQAPRDTGGITLRPFRKINDIVPYDSYEPDPEVAAQDHCYNLCPRPKGGDCPDCNSDESGGLACPECPWEQDLRRIGRQPGEPDIPFVPRDFAHIHYCWEPTNLYHNPIYFEDVPLERYGHTRHYMLIQPFFSVSKFALQLVGLPYQMSLFPVWDRQYSLGYYRPGEYVPYKYFQIPLNAKAAAVEAGVITGSYFLFAPGVGP